MLTEGFDTYVRHEWPELREKEVVMHLTNKYTHKREKLTVRKVGKGEIDPVHKLLFEFLNNCLLPNSERRHEATYLDMVVMEVLDKNRPINLPYVMLKHITRVVDQERGTHVLPYGFLFTRVFEHFKVPLRSPEKGTKKDLFDEETLKECDCVSRPLGTKIKSMVTNLLEELVATNEEKEKLKEELPH